MLNPLPNAPPPSASDVASGQARFAKFLSEDGRIDAGGTWTLTYRTDGLRLSESSTSGRAATWTMNAQGRRYSLTAQAHAAAVGTSPYMSYDSRGRFSGATSYTNTAPYYHGVTVGYRAGTYLPSSRTYGVNFISTLSESLGYDAVGQMNSRSFANSTNQTLQSFAPTYDQGGVSQVVREGSQKWAYSYDARQQVAQGWKQFTTGAVEVLEGTQNHYTYDLIGNRNTWSGGGGSMLGVGLRANTFGAGASGNSADSLNRYASIVRPQFFDVTGQRAAGAAILVNGAPPTYQQGANGLYFRKEVAANSSGRYTATTVTANGVTTDAWNQYVAVNPEPYTYDADGNLLTDSRWTYTWDAENRLTSATSQPQANPPLAVNGVKAEFTYDGLSRRIEKRPTRIPPSRRPGCLTIGSCMHMTVGISSLPPGATMTRAWSGASVFTAGGRISAVRPWDRPPGRPLEASAASFSLSIIVIQPSPTSVCPLHPLIRRMTTTSPARTASATLRGLCALPAARLPLSPCWTTTPSAGRSEPLAPPLGASPFTSRANSRISKLASRIMAIVTTIRGTGGGYPGIQ